MAEDDPFDLRRFVAAQDPVMDVVRAELAAGRKRTHWMWFVFPQIAGLGRSRMAQAFAISSLDEAHAYLAHPVLGARLRECVGLAMAAPDRSAHGIFGSPDDMKFRSCLTLFREAGGGDIFDASLARFFAGEPDQVTLRLLGAAGPGGDQAGGRSQT
jgi:uncharacterized protein (DUF1810 family)